MVATAEEGALMHTTEVNVPLEKGMLPHKMVETQSAALQSLFKLQKGRLLCIVAASIPRISKIREGTIECIVMGNSRQ